VEREIAHLISAGQNMVEENKFIQFPGYKNLIATWARKTFSGTDDVGIKHLLVKLLELPLDYSILYKWLLIREFRFDLLFNWSEEGKYKYYIERSNTLLDAIRYRLSNRK
jgi:hypothetical protein